MILSAHQAQETDYEDRGESREGANRSVAVRWILRDDVEIERHRHEHRASQGCRCTAHCDGVVMPLIRLVDVGRDDQGSGMSRPKVVNLTARRRCSGLKSSIDFIVSLVPTHAERLPPRVTKKASRGYKPTGKLAGNLSGRIAGRPWRIASIGP